MSSASEVKTALRKKKAPVEQPLGLSSGSTLLNLACSGKPDVGFLVGHVYCLVGDSNSGKTFLSLTCLAEAANNPAFDNYRFIHDNVERGALMDFAKFFGSKMADRVEPPSRDSDGEPIYSTTVESFYDHVDDNLKKGPCIYVLDSMDALSSESELTKFQKNKKARKKQSEGNDADIKGSYGDGKAKANSAGLRIIHNTAAENDSIIIIIFQSRDNIGFGAVFNPKTRSGGNAPTFYCSLEIWSSVKEKLKKEANDKDRVVGTLCKLQVKKNRITGQDRTVYIPIFYSAGLDETGSLVNYLILENHWKGSKTKVIAPEFDHNGSIEDLVHKLESESKVNELQLITSEVWKDIESQAKIERVPRYA